MQINKCETVSIGLRSLISLCFSKACRANSQKQILLFLLFLAYKWLLQLHFTQDSVYLILLMHLNWALQFSQDSVHPLRNMFKFLELFSCHRYKVQYLVEFLSLGTKGSSTHCLPWTPSPCSYLGLLPLEAIYLPIFTFTGRCSLTSP